MYIREKPVMLGSLIRSKNRISYELEISENFEPGLMLIIIGFRQLRIDSHLISIILLNFSSGTSRK
jgi:hypothetical protein